ncbi:MAG: alpha-L-fucosidase [Verrucomicrobia bacterium]|nr:alpha-L-fucosidase [Verrucomicrobiota bacterium]
MKKAVFALLSAVVALGLPLGAQTADTEIDRESKLRFPESANSGKLPDYMERDPEPDYRHASAAAYQAFRDIKYGVRIHWGLYSLLPAAAESWSFLPMNNEERQVYQERYQTWNPQGFNAEEWMGFFNRAGFRSFAITTKHHDGFSLWDTKTRVRQRTNWTAPGGPGIESCDLAYSIMETPFKRDVIKELCDAARRHDIKIDLYFSHPDWYDADFRPCVWHPLQTGNAGKGSIKELEKRQRRPATLHPDRTPKETARMIARHREQLRELLTNYGKIDMVCLDMWLDAEVWPDLRETIKEMRRLQPDVMFRNRGIGNYGDYHTPERVVPSGKSEQEMPWMVIYPLGRNFSWEGDGSKYKGAKWVVRNLADSVAKGGNFMVGIGPDGNGRFHPTAIQQLEEVGAWLKVNGEGIFSTQARPGDLWHEGDDVRFTESKDRKTVYAILLRRPDAPVDLKTIQPVPGSKVTLLGYQGELKWQTASEGVSIEFPSAAPDAIAHVLKIQARQ